MLGVTSERFPDGGALALAIVGGTGTLSAAIFTWILGGLYDRAGPRMALRYMAVLPVVLIAILSAIRLHDRRRGGGAR
jgi:MFS-type transporter involved in bile tolerance (Atg22 family)